MSNVIFVTWEKHQRTRTLCTKLGITLCEKLNPHKGVKRYISLLISTIRTIHKEKPDVLITQNPSVILCVLALVLRPIYRYRLFIDAHNEAITPYIHDNFVFRLIAKQLAKKADLVIVTNKVLSNTVNSYGGNSFILPDLLPDTLNNSAPAPRPRGYFQITLISTYAPDEPYQNVFEAICQLDDNIKMFVTGKIPKHLQTDHIDSRIHLTGYLSDHDYEQLLHESDLIIDLTTMENCLVCGAYEALAIEKPMVLSKDPVNEELFPCAVLTHNDAISIARSIKSALSDMDYLQNQTSLYKATFHEKEKRNLSLFLEKIKNA